MFADPNAAVGRRQQRAKQDMGRDAPVGIAHDAARLREKRAPSVAAKASRTASATSASSSVKPPDRACRSEVQGSTPRR